MGLSGPEERGPIHKHVAVTVAVEPAAPSRPLRDGRDFYTAATGSASGRRWSRLTARAVIRLGRRGDGLASKDSNLIR